MVLFLTSDVGAIKNENGVRVASKLNNTNNFVDELQKFIINGENFLFVASNPNSFMMNDTNGMLTFNSFNLSGFNFKNLNILDSRNRFEAENLVKNASIVFLAGGNTIKQMQFFREINLSKLLKKYSPIIIGQSAGALNLAENVYCSPENEKDINDVRYFSGLGLTKISIEPHFRNSLDFAKFDVLEKILLEDSKKKPFIAITDGSYIVDDGEEQTIFGEAYAFSNGDYQQISQDKESLCLSSNNLENNQNL